MRFDITFKVNEERESRIQRYLQNFPYLNENQVIELGERRTPIVRVDNNTLFKLDYMNPTFSFKDRGSQVLVSYLAGKAVKGIREDSSGNAGASLAAYSARAGIKCYIFVPSTVSGAKAQQTEAYGATLIKVKGSRNDVTSEAMKERKDSIYAGHVYHPYFWDGMRTIAYEIYEELGEEGMPELIFLPVSAGTLLLGLAAGLKHLLNEGKIGKIPKLVCSQTETVSPLYHRLKGEEYIPPKELKTFADALVSVKPPLLELMVKVCRSLSSDCVVVPEEEIIESWRSLSRRGFFVEPSSAVAYAAFKGYDMKKISDNRRLVILTGAGLKRPII